MSSNIDTEKYVKMSHKEHIKEIPDTYVGSIENIEDEMYIYEDNKIIKKRINYIPALYKLFDEILVNARDATINDNTCNNLECIVNIEEGYISVYNNGDNGIPIEEHPEYKTLIPSMIFGELLTSSNYDKNIEKTTGGKNGYGAKLVNIFSKKFIVEINDAKRKKYFIQEWTNNMSDTDGPKITKSSVKSSVKITYYPDFERFNISGLTEDYMKLFYRRLIDIAGTTDNKLKIVFNNNKIEINNFKLYIELYYDLPIYYDSNDRWTIGVLYKQESNNEVISFVNGINTYRGGTHCNYVIDIIIKHLINDYIKKKDKELKISPLSLKDNFVFFINSIIINPSFSSQIKDTLTTKIDKFGSKYDPSPTFLKKLSKCGIVERILEIAKTKESSSLKKTDGKKQIRIIGIPKLEDANKAGTKEAYKCTLILTEGDSAKATAIAGLSVIGKDYYGVFPLKGKLLNVREATTLQLLHNEEIKNLKIILGLKQDEDYSLDEKFNTLRYGHVLLLTDADSVTSDTPLLLKNNNNLIEIRTIDDISNNWISYNNKEISYSLYKIWTDKGWTIIRKVIRHKVIKKIYRIKTYSGCVDVTEDHSLINKYGKELTPKQCYINQELLHCFPNFNKDLYNINKIKIMPYSELKLLSKKLNIKYKSKNKNQLLYDILKKISLENNYTHRYKTNNLQISEKEAYMLGYNWSDNDVNIPIQILNSTKKIKKLFFRGFYINKNYTDSNVYFKFIIKNKLRAQNLYFLCKSIGYNIIINNKNSSIYYTLIIKKSSIKKKLTKIISIELIGNTEQYVYDLETENHHFQAGIGEMIVHNTDGSHIQGLFMNLIHYLWPNLIKRKNFIQGLNTPILKAFKGKETLSFYNLTDFESWKLNTSNYHTYKIKHYKGLGTSTAAEAKEYFININDKIINYLWENIANDIIISSTQLNDDDEDNDIEFIPIHDDEDAIKLAFDKKRANERKKWLMAYDKNKIIKYEQKNISIYDFIHYVLIHYSNEDLERSIPSVVDGFKPSQRKILFGSFARGLDKDEVKVAQLAGFVSDKAAYHHGEMSLTGAIIGMAQNYVGSNNINLLKPNGQFGSRYASGKDHASSRYIWTQLSPLALIIFNSLDTPVLNHLIDDGISIEPEYYVPIIPMILINGTEGIGTGFSTKIPPFNPINIIDNLINMINNKPIQELYPWWNKFEGTIIKTSESIFEVKGKWIIENNKLIITELPIGESTIHYKEFLEKLLIDSSTQKKTTTKKIKKENPLISYTDNNTDTKVYFELTFEDNYLNDESNDIEKNFHLSKKIHISNMHLYSPDGHIKKYNTIQEIMEDYYNVRLNIYDKRKTYLLNILEHQLNLISYKIKFIMLIVKNELIINNKKKSIIESELEQLKFPKLNKSINDTHESYEYLLSMPIFNLTFEKIEELELNHKNKLTEYNHLFALSAKDIWLSELVDLKDKYLKSIEIDSESTSNKLPNKRKTKK